jgi:putative transposase
MVTSMSRKGNCWDNAFAESTFATIKAELFNDQVPENIHAVELMLFPYIEGVYNRRRLHSTLGHVSPAEKELLAVAGRKVS